LVEKDARCVGGGSDADGMMLAYENWRFELR
jgi:hypothetical protein